VHAQLTIYEIFYSRDRFSNIMIWYIYIARQRERVYWQAGYMSVSHINKKLKNYMHVNTNILIKVSSTWMNIIIYEISTSRRMVR
jgi:hypothetical protein